MFLSREELSKLARRTQRAAILRWLNREKIPYRLDADLFPIVAEDDIRAKSPTIKSKPAVPNLEWLKHGKAS